MRTLQAIYVYPVKSMAALSLPMAEVQPRGLKHDRRWMVTEPDGRFLTQRDHPRLALVNAMVEGDAVRLKAPDLEPVIVEPNPQDDRAVVEVWGDRVEAVPAHEAGDAWISRYLGVPARLVFMAADSVRRVDPAYGTAEDEVSFADGFPLLLATAASLDDLNARLPEPVPMSRFRPNLVIAGTEPFEEDTWREIRIGAVRFRVVKPCARCVVTTVDQGTGRFTGKEPLRMLAQYRNVEGKALFAQNLIPLDTGVIRVGDRVMV